MNSQNALRWVVGLVVAAAVCLGSVPLVHAGPVVYWTFDNTVNDSVGSSHGVLNGGAGYSATVPGGLTHSTASLALNAGNVVTDWFSAPVGIGVQNSYTVSAWTNMRDNVGNRNFFDTRSGGNTFDVKFGTSPLSSNPSIHGDVGNGSGWINTNADADIAAAAGTWYHVAYVVDQWSYQIYVDGTQLTPVASGTFAAANSPMLFPGTSEVNIGRYSGGSEYFNGYIDDVSVWDTALSADEIAALADGTAPTAITEKRTSNSTGALKYLPITGDADSDISTAKTYTHKLDFGNSPVATVNSVVFDQGQNGDFAAYACDIPNAHGGNGVHGIPATEGVADLLQDMNYNNSDATMLLKGLTVGQAYDARLYMRSWGVSDRTQTITFDVDSDGAADKTIRVNEDDAAKGGNVYVPGFDSTQPYALSYNFVAESEEMAIGIKQRGGGSFHIYGLTNEETDRVPINSLFSTGLGDDGVALLGGAADPHYVLVAGAQGDPGEQALAVTNHPAWAFNDDGSGFISVASPGGTTNIEPGAYTYATTFDLTGLSPATAEILMTIFADNEITDVRLNGVSTGFTMIDDPDHVFPFFTHANSGTFLLDSGFLPGINTLEFDLYNVASALEGGVGPGALRVEMSGSAVIPEPSTLVLLLGAVAGMLLAIRRRRSTAYGPSHKKCPIGIDAKYD